MSDEEQEAHNQGWDAEKWASGDTKTPSELAPAACCAALSVQWRAKARELRREYSKAHPAAGVGAIVAEWLTLELCAVELDATLAQHNDKAQRPPI